MAGGISDVTKDWFLKLEQILREQKDAPISFSISSTKLFNAKVSDRLSQHQMSSDLREPKKRKNPRREKWSNFNPPPLGFCIVSLDSSRLADPVLSSARSSLCALDLGEGKRERGGPGVRRACFRAILVGETWPAFQRPAPDGGSKMRGKGGGEDEEGERGRKQAWLHDAETRYEDVTWKIRQTLVGEGLWKTSEMFGKAHGIVKAWKRTQ